MTTSIGAGGIYSDDFQSGGSLDGIWAETDPQGDCTVALTGQGTGNAFLEITVPQSGLNHDAYIPNNACRVLQPVTSPNVSFSCTVKMEGAKPSASYQSRGLMVVATEDSGHRYYRLDNYYGGSDYVYTGLGFGVGVTGFQQKANVNLTTTVTDPFWLRITRTYVDGVNDNWETFYSLDGSAYTSIVTWESGPDSGDEYTFTPAYIGVFAGNSNNPAQYTAKFDYFFEDSAPISPEDGVGGPAPRRVMVR